MQLTHQKKPLKEREKCPLRKLAPRSRVISDKARGGPANNRGYYSHLPAVKPRHAVCIPPAYVSRNPSALSCVPLLYSIITKTKQNQYKKPLTPSIFLSPAQIFSLLAFFSLFFLGLRSRNSRPKSLPNSFDLAANFTPPPSLFPFVIGSSESAASDPIRISRREKLGFRISHI